MSEFNYSKDASGIVTIAMDMAGPVNSMNADYRKSMFDCVNRLESETDLRGVIIASAKDTFFAGGDLKELYGFEKGQEQTVLAVVEALKVPLRKLEQLPVPVVAAINGAALGGGFEICLACNYRIIENKPSAVVGLPEVTLGLLPGGGGVVRLIHLLGFEKALPYLLEGRKASPLDAIDQGLVDEVVQAGDDLVERAKEWIKANPECHEQPWDMKGHAIPGGDIRNPKVVQQIQFAALMVFNKTRGLLPAPQRIVSVATDAVSLDFDTALKIESRSLTYLITTAEAKNIINSRFFQLNKINRGLSRPKVPAKHTVRSVGIVGGGSLGKTLACSSAIAGISVELINVRSSSCAEDVVAHCEQQLAKRVDKGVMTDSEKASVLARINIAVDNVKLDCCDLVIESDCDDLDEKKNAIAATECFLTDHGVYATCTSMQSVTQLAESVTKPENFIGLHFVNLPQKTSLVEMIVGKNTSDEAFAKAFDYVRQINKTPIVVTDSPGFFTIRVLSAFLDEGARLLEEGVSPVLIDRLALQIGMSAGPLATQDELSLPWVQRVAKTYHGADVPDGKCDMSTAVRVSDQLMGQFDRGGRHHGGGFYDYLESGEKQFWPKLKELYPASKLSIAEKDIVDRLLYRQIIESVKCLQDGVLASVSDGNIGSLLSGRAPEYTGGFLQYLNTFGMRTFSDRAKQLSERFGDRFEPPSLLVDKASSEQLFI